MICFDQATTKNDMMTKDDFNISEETLSLFQQIFMEEEADIIENCPFSEKAIAYALDELGSREGQDARNHLLDCRACLDLFFDVRMAETEAREQEEHIPESQPSVPWERIRLRLKNSFLSRKQMLAPGFAMVAALSLLVFLLWPCSLPDRIHKSYQTVLAQKLSFENDDLNEIINLPWEKEADHLAFGVSNRDAPLYRAFGAGLWAGRRELGLRTYDAPPDFLSPGWPDSPGTEPDKWSEMPRWSACFQMGQWCFLMQAVCVSGAELPDAFWEEQRIIMDEIRKGFETHTPKTDEDDRFVNDRLAKIRSVLEHPHPGRMERRIIAEEAESLIGHLSPRVQG